jgi:hypothetical protein
MFESDRDMMCLRLSGSPMNSTPLSYCPRECSGCLHLETIERLHPLL